MAHWNDVVKDDAERAVFDALADRRYKFRTVEGLAKSTNLAVGEVEEILDKFPSLVRMAPVPDDKGRGLYTLRAREVDAGELWATVRSALTKSFR
jgi:hypothetical protein